MAEVVGIAAGAIGLAASFILASDLAAQIQEMLPSQQLSSGFQRVESGFVSFRLNLDMLAHRFVDENWEFTSSQLNSTVQKILQVTTTSLMELRTIFQEVPPAAYNPYLRKVRTKEIMKIMRKLEAIESSMQLVMRIGPLFAGVHQHAAPGGGPDPHGASPVPGSGTSTQDLAAICHPEHANNQQKRFFDKLFFDPQPIYHIRGTVTDGDNTTNTPAVAPMENQLLSTLTTGNAPPVSGSRGGLMLILCEAGAAKANTLPFDRATFTRLVNTIQIPLGSFQALFTGTPKFVHYAALDDTPHAGLVLRTPSSITENWTLALSYDEACRNINGIIHGMQPLEMTRLAAHIGDTRRESVHPMNIPLILCEMLVESDSNGVKLHASNLHKVEKRTNFYGYTPIRPANNSSGQAKAPEQDFAEMTQSLNLIISRLAFHEMRLHANAVFIDEMSESLAKMRVNGDSESHQKCLIYSSRVWLPERLAHLKTEQRALLLEISCNQKIAQSQLQIVYSLIAQRDNKDNLAMATTQTDIAETTKEDSFAMRTIAIMSIAFLPGTFVSSFFSMDMFDWQAPKGASVLSSRFWIYWAVTVPLTLLVFSIWFVWLRRHEHETEGRSVRSRPLSEWRNRVSRTAEERRPWYQFRMPKTVEEDEEKQDVEEIVVRPASITVDAPLRNRGPAAQIARADTVLQGPIR